MIRTNQLSPISTNQLSVLATVDEDINDNAQLNGHTFKIQDQDMKSVLWIRIRMDPELLPGSGSGSGTRKIQSWIRIRNK